MSRLSSEYCIWLLRDTVCLREQRRRTAVDAPGIYRHASADADTLLPIIRDLLPAGRGKTVDVRLGFPWSRHVVVPWQDQLVDDASWLAWTAATCDAIGVGAADSRFALTPIRYGRPRLAVTVHGGLLEAIGQCVGQRGLRLRSVTSTFAHAMHLYRGKIPGSDAALVLHEHGTLTCALLHHGSAAAVTTQATNGQGGGQVASLVSSLALSSAFAAPSCVAVIGDGLAPGHTATWLGPHLPRDLDEERNT